MGKKITNLSRRFGNWPEVAGRKMMIRYVNKDWDFDIVAEVEKKIGSLGNKGNGEWAYAKHILNYWKYKFLIAQKRDKEALYHLKKSFKEGGPDAMAQYAYFYYTGQVITNKVNKKKAIDLFDEALDEESMFAEYLYAEAILYGNEDDIDVIKEAIPYFETALEKGVVFCRYKLADFYVRTNQKLDVAERLFAKCSGGDARERVKEVKTLRAKLKR